MTKSKKLGFLLMLGAIGLLGLELDERSSTSQTGGWGIISTAEARVGRPLTPVSVAGVARRTTRRCAAGVYNC